LEFPAGGPASRGSATTVGLEPHQSRRPGPAAVGSELAGRGRPGDPDPSPPTPAPSSAGAAAGAPAGTGQGLPAGRGPAATGQPERSRPAAEALAGLGPAGRGGPVGPTPTTTASGAAAGAGVAPRVPARFNLQVPDLMTLQPTGGPAPPPSKKARPASALKAAAYSFSESAGLLRGYTLYFRVIFHEPKQRSSRTATTTVIQRALCGWGRKQRLGFTLDVLETPDSLEGIVEGVNNGCDTVARGIRPRCNRRHTATFEAPLALYVSFESRFL